MDDHHLEGPYAAPGERLLSLRLPDCPPAPKNVNFSGSDERWKIVHAYLDYGTEVLSTSRAVLVYWNPTRLEGEALRRAGDTPGSTVIAEEASQLMERYQNWAAPLLEWEVAANGYMPSALTWGQSLVRARQLRGDLREVLDVLERRAVAIETRALDLRLRDDALRLRRELGSREVAGALREAIVEATRNTASADHMRALGERLAKLEDRFPMLDQMGKDVAYIGDWVMAEFAERKLPPPERVALVKTTEFVFSTVASATIKYLLKEKLGIG